MTAKSDFSRALNKNKVVYRPFNPALRIFIYQSFMTLGDPCQLAHRRKRYDSRWFFVSQRPLVQTAKATRHEIHKNTCFVVLYTFYLKYHTCELCLHVVCGPSGSKTGPHISGTRDVSTKAQHTTAGPLQSCRPHLFVCKNMGWISPSIDARRRY